MLFRLVLRCPSFDLTDIGSVQSTLVRESLLTQTKFVSPLTNPSAEVGGHR